MKKILSILLAIIMVATSLGAGTFAFAEEAQESVATQSAIRIDFDATNKIVKLGDSLTLTATASYTNAEGKTVNEPAGNLDILSYKEKIGTTDKSGRIVIKANKLGIFNITATGTFNGSDIVAPHCIITVTSDLEKYVDGEINEISKALVPLSAKYTIDNAVTYLNYIKSGYDMSKYNAAFVNSVKDTLEKNDGKLPKTEVYGYDYTMGTYAAVIQILDELDYNPSDFNGVDLVKQFTALDLGDVKYQPYYYRVAIETAVNVGDMNFAKALADDLIDTYYTVGKGMDYYGFSCDNTANFISAISYVKDSFKFYLNDAKKLLKTYEKENGFTYSPEFDANADSTATALMAYSLIGDVDRAFDIYKVLVENYEEKLGSFGNNLTLGNCLPALEYFADVIFSEDYEHPEHINKLTSSKEATCTAKGEKVYTCVICGEVTKTELPELEHKAVKDKAVAATFTKTGLTEGSRCSVCGKVITAQKTVAKKKPTVSKLTAGKKQFKLTWKAASGITGYQVQYSTDKNFKKGNKTVTVKGAKKTSATVKKLKSKKTYYVRVRTYKGKNYSSWSKVKTVKVK